MSNRAVSYTHLDVYKRQVYKNYVKSNLWLDVKEHTLKLQKCYKFCTESNAYWLRWDVKLYMQTKSVHTEYLYSK